MPGVKLTSGRAAGPIWWPQGASFAADFCSNRYMVFGRQVRAEDILEFSRPTPKFAQDAAGDWQRFAPHAMARTSRGVLLECAASEYVPRNTILGETPATGPGAAVAGWSVVGGDPSQAQLLPEQLVKGIRTQPFRLSAGGGLCGLATIALPHVSAQAYTLSLYARCPPGAQPADLCWQSPLGAAEEPPIAAATELGSAWKRFDLTVTAPDTGSSPLVLAIPASAPSGSAIDWALPMLRDTGATSFIESLGAGSGRAADSLQVPTDAIGLTPQQGTVIVRNSWGAIIPYNRAIDISDGGTDNRINIERVGSTGTFQATLRSGGEIVGVTEALGGFDDGEYHVQGVSWASDNQFLFLSDLALRSDHSSRQLEEMSVLSLGRGANEADENRTPNGYFAKVTAYPHSVL
ncbi:hypothetical protein GGR20_003441 [Devosia subaequoris]|uniref:Uncharacterized protein n=1 Tax=Devosia subaequoris TaxID=395930 RepID=A0A7W6IQF2_9HYPH|nr:hypothetical protein [Devosia subaequoris]MBB4053779.1 hypothetical protein [Devosia subaequoris]MCP1211024.1 hypothetical protein [Devosia subaequoris]